MIVLLLGPATSSWGGPQRAQCKLPGCCGAGCGRCDLPRVAGGLQCAMHGCKRGHAGWPVPAGRGRHGNVEPSGPGARLITPADAGDRAAGRRDSARLRGARTPRRGWRGGLGRRPLPRPLLAACVRSPPCRGAAWPAIGSALPAPRLLASSCALLPTGRSAQRRSGLTLGVLGPLWHRRRSPATAAAHPPLCSCPRGRQARHRAGLWSRGLWPDGSCAGSGARHPHRPAAPAAAGAVQHRGRWAGWGAGIPCYVLRAGWHSLLCAACCMLCLAANLSPPSSWSAQPLAGLHQTKPKLLLLHVVQANGLTATAAAAELAWGTLVGHLQPPFDVVLASDVLYLAEALPLFVATLAQLCGPGTQVSWVGVLAVVEPLRVHSESSYSRPLLAACRMMPHLERTWSIIVQSACLHPYPRCSMLYRRCCCATSTAPRCPSPGHSSRRRGSRCSRCRWRSSTRSGAARTSTCSASSWRHSSAQHRPLLG